MTQGKRLVLECKRMLGRIRHRDDVHTADAGNQSKIPTHHLPKRKNLCLDDGANCRRPKVARCREQACSGWQRGWGFPQRRILELRYQSIKVDMSAGARREGQLRASRRFGRTKRTQHRKAAQRDHAKQHCVDPEHRTQTLFRHSPVRSKATRKPRIR